jgi:glycosyltransferase involved in cell wall biosynthesis
MAAPDVVVSLSSPPGLSLAGAIIAGLHRARHYVWEMDLYPDVAVDIGILRPDNLFVRVFGSIMDGVRRRSEAMIAPGECMAERLSRHGLAADRIHVVHNWADGREIWPRPFRNDGILKILYSGTLGRVHDLRTVRDAILRLKDDPGIRFTFASRNNGLHEMEEFRRKHRAANMECRPCCLIPELGESLANGDVGLVTQKAECAGSVVPSKLYGILAAGRPIVFVGPGNSTPAAIIERFRCGWHVAPGDVDGLVNLLRSLVVEPDEVLEAGNRARIAFERHFDRLAAVQRISEILSGRGKPESRGMAR